LAFVATLAAVVCVMVFGASEAAGQNPRRQMRMQKKIEKKLDRQSGNQNKLTPTNSAKDETNTSDQPETAAPRAMPPQAGKNSLDGIRQRGVRSIFTPEEATLIIPGFGNSPPLLLLVFRQLDLTPEQKVKIRAIRQRVGRSLVLSRNELMALEGQLDEAIYGTNDPASLDNYDPRRVEELAERVAQKRGEIMKMQTAIESQLRQILTPDQFFVFRELLREMLAPGRRPAPGVRQPPRRLGAPPNPQTRPNPPDNK
jgi:Spy/CpxP family protein refolding chaperone